LMARDNFPYPVKAQLASRVNHRCSNPDCRAPTSGPQLDTTASMNVGVAAHITAAAARGPRYDRDLPPQDRRSPTNGIWLCQTCAKLVDNDEEKFTPVLLREWKRDAEAEAEKRIGKAAPHPASVPILESIHGQLRRDGNPRFGFSFVHPSVWDRDDPTNGDGNTYRHPKDSRIELRVWGHYAVISPDLHSWIEWTIESLQKSAAFCLLTRVRSGGHVVDWEERGQNVPVEVHQNIEGCRIVYETVDDDQRFTNMLTFLQYGDTQFNVCCRAPTALYEHYEELFLTISKEFRIFGENSAPFARAMDARKSP
jgi:hypothetical protein